MARPQHRRNGPKEAKEFDEEVIQIDRVTRVVAGGRRLRFRATVVIGNRKKKVGIGIGKANEVQMAIAKAISKAKKNLITVPIERDSIPHEVQIKFKAAKILMMPAKPGTGIIAGGALRKIIELAGIKNILSKCFGTNNKLANAKAAIMALQKLQPVMKQQQPQQMMAPKGEKPMQKKPDVKKQETTPIESVAETTAKN